MFIVVTKKQATGMIVIIIIVLLLIMTYTTLSSLEMKIHNKMTIQTTFKGDWSDHLDPFQPAKKGYSVLVDLDSKILYLYEDREVIKSWPVSGGSKENPSPTGSWVVTGIGNWDGAFGGSWIALNVPWGKYGIHGTVEPWTIGSDNVSHGCIRMKNDDVAELKEYMSEGVPVYIKYDNAPFRALKDGKVGSDVLKLQMMLKQLGYYDEVPDGEYGKQTYEAVRRFQEDEQIKVDGIVGKRSWDMLQLRVWSQ